MGRIALAVVPVALAAALGGAGATARSGHVQLLVTDHRAGIEDFITLSVELAEVALHAAGQPRHRGWSVIARGTAPVDLVPLKAGRSVVVATAPVPPGAYDAVRVRLGRLGGTTRARTPARIVGQHSTVAAPLRVAAGLTRKILLDLYVEDQTDHEPGRYVVKLLEVRIPAP